MYSKRLWSIWLLLLLDLGRGFSRKGIPRPAQNEAFSRRRL